MSLRREYEFTLPDGYVDKDGKLHRNGVMRLSTATDEIIPLKDPRVQQNPSYLTIVILSRVIVQLGTIQTIDTNLIEGLFARDLAFLNDMYQRLNGLEEQTTSAVCPQCGFRYDAPINFTKEV